MHINRRATAQHSLSSAVFHFANLLCFEAKQPVITSQFKIQINDSRGLKKTWNLFFFFARGTRNRDYQQGSLADPEFKRRTRGDLNIFVSNIMHPELIDVQVHRGPGRHNLRRGMLELFYGTPNVRAGHATTGGALKFLPRKWYRLREEVARRTDKSRNDKTTAKTNRP